MYPTYDDDLKILYLAGIGDTVIRYYEFYDGHVYPLDSYNDGSAS